jgi:hypothetical protein
VNRIPLRPAILCLNDDPGSRREDGLSPPIAILQTNPVDEITQRARPVETFISTAWIYPHEIVSVSLAKQVGSVTWDSRSGSVGGNPFAPEREVNNDWSKHRRI